MSFYDELKDATEQARQAFMAIPIIQAGTLGKIDRDAYIAFLSQAYYHVSHTVPLLMACGSRLDAAHEWLREAVGEYITEEMGHQEWILNDIAACGADAEAVRNAIPHPSTELMVAYAYDTIHRGNPVGFFGMVLVLEGTSISLASRAADAIQENLGLPDTAFSYLRSHGELDIGHMEIFANLMSRIQSKQDQQAVIHSANMFYRLYGDVFRSLPINTDKSTQEDHKPCINA